MVQKVFHTFHPQPPSPPTPDAALPSPEEDKSTPLHARQRFAITDAASASIHNHHEVPRANMRGRVPRLGRGLRRYASA